jgi:hypothetical protein
MGCLSVFSTETRYHHPSSEKNHTPGTISSRIHRIFKGPSERQSQPHYRNEKEKEYRHVPTHSASSFMRTTTTPTMIEADPNFLAGRPQGENGLIDAEPRPDHSMPPESLI